MADKIKIALLSILLIIILYLFAHRGVSFFGNVEETVLYIRRFKILAPLIGFFLIVLQAQIPYVPFFILAGANGVIFGFGIGFFLSWSAALTGATLNFYIARFLGHNWFSKHLSSNNLQKMHKLTEEKGFFAILIARLIPVFPASLINIAAGISDIRLNTFLAASALGKIPAVLIYSYLGYEILKIKNLSLFTAIAAIIMILAYILFRRFLKSRL